MSEVNGQANGLMDPAPCAMIRFRPFVSVLGLVIIAVLVIFLIKDHRPSVHEIGPINGIAFCPDGKQLVTANQDGSVRLWDVESGQELRCFQCHRSGAVSAVAITPDGLKLVADTYQVDEAHDFNHPDYGLVVWELGSGKLLFRLLGSKGQITAVTVCPDNAHILAACRDRTIREWDITTGHITLCLQGHEGDINAVAVTSDGKLVVSGSGDYSGGQLHDASVRIWNRQTGKLVRTFDKLTDAVDGVSVAPDGSKVASCGWDGYVRIWELSSGEQLMRMGTGMEQFHSVAFSPDGQKIAATSHLVKIWDASTGKEVCQAKGEYSVSHCVAFSPDGKRAATGHGYFGGDALNAFGSPLAKVVDGVARIWDVKTGEEIKKLGSTPEQMKD